MANLVPLGLFLKKLQVHIKVSAAVVWCSPQEAGRAVTMALQQSNHQLAEK
jgi:hypothetical protein